jgi:predicted nuclease of predicted toxin-antitoxin system
MKFLCDVHISYKVAKFLSEIGFEAVHVNQILDRWNTKDKDICRYADENDFIVISKDYDFRNSYFIHGTPQKLIKINLGNISTKEVISTLSKILSSIEKLSANSSFLVEIDHDRVTFLGEK